jgi:tRNA(adenine34) deaminase
MGSYNILLCKHKKVDNWPAMKPTHNDLMQLAIEEALKAERMGEVPVGAVIVDADSRLIARDHNRPISTCDPSAHAEMNVIRAAANNLGNYRLLKTTLYVTIEPCAMCMGAIVHARIARVVFGAVDQKWGAAGSLYNLGQDTRLNHQVEIISGINEDRCRSIIQTFFRSRRKTG